MVLSMYHYEYLDEYGIPQGVIDEPPELQALEAYEVYQAMLEDDEEDEEDFDKGYNYL
jgi:hypothetical protein